METTSTTTVTGSSTTTSSTSAAAATAASDFQTFLQLLTAQMRNQDPLSPLDSTQFVEQLASFSAVEQQIETNDRLAELADLLGGSALDEASRWVGQNVEITSGAAAFDGTALSYSLADSSSGDENEVVVYDAAGAEVYRATLSAGERAFTWNGETNDGSVAPVGEYAITVNSYEDGSLIGVAEPVARTWVRQARFEEDGVSLVLGNGVIADPSQITALWAESDQTTEPVDSDEAVDS